MILKGLLLVLAIIVFGLLTLLSLILFIIKWNKTRVRNYWVLGFFLSLLLTASSAKYLIDKVVEKAEHLQEQRKARAEKGWDDSDESEDDPNKVNFDTSISQIRLLKEYEAPKYKKIIPSAFYSYFGMRDHYRFPLVYPYSLNCIDHKETGQLYDERFATELGLSDKGIIQLPFYSISHIAFDKNYLLAKQDDAEIGKTYFLFTFHKQDIEYFRSKKELLLNAKNKGYTGPSAFMSIEQYEDLFRDY